MLAPGPFAVSTRREPLVLRDATSHCDHLAVLSELALLQKVLVTLRSPTPFTTTPSQCFMANPSLGRQENGCTWLVWWFPPFPQRSSCMGTVLLYETCQLYFAFICRQERPCGG